MKTKISNGFSLLKHIKALLIYLLVFIVSTPATGQMLDEVDSPVLSIETVKHNQEKVLGGYVGFWSGAIAGWVVGAGLSTGGLFAALVLTPVSGSLGSSLGVYTVGDMQGENSNFVQTVWGGIKGSVYGIWSWLIPVPILNPLIINPASPSLYSIDEYNRYSIPMSRKNSFRNAVSTDPIRAVWGAGRTVGLAQRINTPLIVEYERTCDKYSLGLEVLYQDQNMLAVEKDWFDGEIFKEETAWRRKHYRATLNTRWFPRGTMSGWYAGLGVAAGYSSLSKKYGDLDLWNKNEGRTFYMVPFAEGGYRLDITPHLFLHAGLRAGPIVELGGSTNNHVNEITSDFSQFFVARAGFRW